MSSFDLFRTLVQESESPDLVLGCGLICESGGYERARSILADQFDNLSMTVEGTDVVSVVRSLRDQLGFDGDRQNYDDPENSMLHLVIERRRGLPILLAVETIPDIFRTVGNVTADMAVTCLAKGVEGRAA